MGRLRGTTRSVVDTNVAVVAQGASQQADQACVDACIDALDSVTKAGGLILDAADEIVDEYLTNLGHAGKPGIGRAFAKWARDYRFNDDLVTRVHVTRRSDGGWRQFDQFPDRQDLATFHKDDQKFVAVAVASGEGTPVLNAVDSDWWNHRAALTAAGISIVFLCPQHQPAPAARQPRRD